MIEQSSGEEDFDLPLVEPVEDFKRPSLRHILNGEQSIRLKAIADPLDLELISLFNPLKLFFILKGQGKDPKVDQIAPVDAGIRLYDNGSDANEHGSQSRMLPARPLSIILTSDQKSASQLFCFLKKIRIQPFKEVF